MTEQKFLKDLENKLWKTADTLRSNISAAEYKHVVLGLVFVKYVSDSFETRRVELKTAFANSEHEYFLGDDADDEFINEELENRDYYTEKNVFWVPQSARWKFIQDNAGLSVGAKLPNGDEFKGIGKFIDDAMEAIEKENPKLKRILNKSYAKLDIDPSKLVALVNLIAEIPFTHNSLKSKDILGHVYEYFLGKFAAAEGQRGGQFYTPKSIVNLIVQMIEPYSGRIYDPAMGSGGFFISSEKFIEAHNGNLGDISVYGQESNPTTWRLAAMNMAIRGIDFNFGKEPRSSFTSDQHPDLRADFVLANPPFNQKEEDWWDASLENDARWNGYPTPPKGNANFAWMLHMLHHSNPTNGVVGLVLANGSLSSTTNNEGEIRKTIVQNDLVEAIVALPSQLFANTQIPACIWILNRNKKQKGKTLFIDTRDFGYMIDRKQRDFSTDDIKTIADVFHKFRSEVDFENIAGKYYSATIEEIVKQEYILTPGRFVGTEEVEDDSIPFKEKMDELIVTLGEQFKESARLEAMIKENLAGLGYEF